MEPHLLKPTSVQSFLLVGAKFCKQTNHQFVSSCSFISSVSLFVEVNISFAPIPDQFGRKGVKKRNHGKWADATDGSAHFTIGKKVEIRGGVVGVYTGGDSAVHIVNY